MIWYIFLFINIPQLCSLLLLFYICFKLFWKVLVVGPFSEIVPYNSTPLDDLLNSFRKLKALDKKGKIKVAAVITAVVLAFVGIGVCINHRKNIENNLTDLTYDIVQESCDNYGDYSKSKYQDIVSEQIYKNMNYLYVVTCTDKNNLEIVESKFTSIEPQILSLKSAEVNYSCYVRYQLNNENDSYIAKDLSYTVQWKSDDNNVWRVSDFDGDL